MKDSEDKAYKLGLVVGNVIGWTLVVLFVLLVVAFVVANFEWAWPLPIIFILIGCIKTRPKEDIKDDNA